MNTKLKRVNGHLVVKNPLPTELPIIRTTLQSGKTTYRFTGSYDGVRSISAKVLRLMEKMGG